MPATPEGKLAPASAQSIPPGPIPPGSTPLGSIPPRPRRTEPVAVDAVAGRIGAHAAPADELAGEHYPHGEPVVTGATQRAQDVAPGDLFAALPGASAHGADFVEQAVAAGAAAILTDHLGAARPAVHAAGIPVLVHESPRQVLGAAAALVYGDPSGKLSVLGVTGTSGKTTTTHLIEAGLAAAGRTPGLIGTVGTRVGGQRLPSAFTTPEAPDLQALLAMMVEQGVTDAAMEVSSHALSLGRVAGTRFAVGAFTNLSQDHLDFHRDMEDYFQAKAMLFDGRANTEVVCVDGDWGRRLVGERTITVASTHGSAAWTATDVRVGGAGGQSFTAHGPHGDRINLSIRLPGAFNVANALLATAVLHAAGVPLLSVAKGLSTVDVPGRMERVALGQDFTAVVDYPHKPAAVAQMLDAVREGLRRSGTGGRVLIVLGCGGDRDAGKRPLMGAAAARRAELLVVTDDNPRSEDPATIRAAMLDGANEVPAEQRGAVLEIGDRRAAIGEAVRQARAGDVVVVAGKGHETGQEVVGVVHPFSDADELAAAIRSRLGEPAPGEAALR